MVLPPSSNLLWIECSEGSTFQEARNYVSGMTSPSGVNAGSAYFYSYTPSVPGVAQDRDVFFGIYCL